MLDTSNASRGRGRSLKTATEAIELMPRVKEHFLTFLDKNPDFNKLKYDQIAFAFFLSQPYSLRGSIKDYAKKTGITRQTLHNWKNNDLVLKLRNEMMCSELKYYNQM